jgi:DNA-directed RNA polymerase subunit RPC12/RpoP
MANLCSVCGKKIGVFTQIKIKDGFVCGDCQNKSLNMSNCSCRSVQDYKDRYAYLEENQRLLAVFSPTISIGEHLQVDENNKLFKIGKSPECFPFSCLVNFELNEDGEAITKGGLGRAAVGGVLFGGVGAVVGGVTGGKKTKTMVNNMYIRISLNDPWIKTAKITLISTEVKKGSILYTPHKALAEQIISALEVIVEKQEQADVSPAQNQATDANSPADEILKYKQLLDIGAITEDEFSQKKKQLLGI